MEAVVDVATLTAMVLGWERQARVKYRSAELYDKDTMERRALEHAAVCVANCALELRAAIPAGLCPPPSATPAAR